MNVIIVIISLLLANRVDGLFFCCCWFQKISIFTPVCSSFIIIIHKLSSFYHILLLLGCDAAEATGLGLVFVLLSTLVSLPPPPILVY